LVPDYAGQASTDGKDKCLELLVPNARVIHESDRLVRSNNTIGANPNEKMDTLDTLLMTQDLSNDDYNLQLMHEIDEENNFLEIDEQPDYEYDALQMQDDILEHINAETEQIIADFENLAHSDTDDNLESYDHENEGSTEFYSQQSSSPSDDLNENTDTEDGAEELIDLINEHIKANTVLLKFVSKQSIAIGRYIKANTKLLTCVSKQSTTIGRLRARIVRLGNMVL
jgi:hypothetical protein